MTTYNEEQAKKEREVALKRQQEQQMLNQLFENAEKWHKCQMAREYIEAVTENPEDNQDNGWVDWAKHQVEQAESNLLYFAVES